MILFKTELSTVEVGISFGDHKVQNIPIPSKIAQQVLIETSIKLPKTLPMIDADVYTNKKLSKERKRQ